MEGANMTDHICPHCRKAVAPGEDATVIALRDVYHFYCTRPAGVSRSVGRFYVTRTEEALLRRAKAEVPPTVLALEDPIERARAEADLGEPPLLRSVKDILARSGSRLEEDDEKTIRDLWHASIYGPASLILDLTPRGPIKSYQRRVVLDPEVARSSVPGGPVQGIETGDRLR
jgi:hypothetical protein